MSSTLKAAEARKAKMAAARLAKEKKINNANVLNLNKKEHFLAATMVKQYPNYLGTLPFGVDESTAVTFDFDAPNAFVPAPRESGFTVEIRKQVATADPPGQDTAPLSVDGATTAPAADNPAAPAAGNPAAPAAGNPAPGNPAAPAAGNPAAPAAGNPAPAAGNPPAPAANNNPQAQVRSDDLQFSDGQGLLYVIGSISAQVIQRAVRRYLKGRRMGKIAPPPHLLNAAKTRPPSVQPQVPPEIVMDLSIPPLGPTVASGQATGGGEAPPADASRSPSAEGLGATASSQETPPSAKPPSVEDPTTKPATETAAASSQETPQSAKPPTTKPATETAAASSAKPASTKPKEAPATKDAPAKPATPGASVVETTPSKTPTGEPPSSDMVAMQARLQQLEAIVRAQELASEAGAHGGGGNKKRAAGAPPKTMRQQQDSQVVAKVKTCFKQIRTTQRMSIPETRSDRYVQGTSVALERAQSNWPHTIHGLFCWTDQTPNEDGSSPASAMEPELMFFVGSEYMAQFLAKCGNTGFAGTKISITSSESEYLGLMKSDSAKAKSEMLSKRMLPTKSHPKSNLEMKKVCIKIKREGDSANAGGQLDSLLEKASKPKSKAARGTKRKQSTTGSSKKKRSHGHDDQSYDDEDEYFSTAEDYEDEESYFSTADTSEDEGRKKKKKAKKKKKKKKDPDTDTEDEEHEEPKKKKVKKGGKERRRGYRSIMNEDRRKQRRNKKRAPPGSSDEEEDEDDY